MPKIIVKDNVLIQASYTLDTVEQRLILLAIAEARETGKGITENSLLEVHASSYINTFGVEKHTAYTVLKNASKSLFDRYVTYHDVNPKTGRDRSFHCRWVDKIGYEQQSGVVFLRFTQDIAPLITRLEEHFTKYELQQVAHLTSSYAIRLYELIIQWRSASKTPILSLDIFRNQMGVEQGQYKTMSNFKKFVLDFAVQQINEHTDITIKYEQHKIGRTITGFSFTFEEKEKPSKVVKEKSKPIQKTAEPKASVNNTWNTPENSMFKSLYAKCPTLTKQYVEKLAKKKNMNIHDLLTAMFIEHAKTDSFELLH